MYMLMTNQPFTRRKSLHHIIDGNGEVVWSGPNIGAALEYLIANDETVFCLEAQPSNKQYWIELHPWTRERYEPAIF